MTGLDKIIERILAGAQLEADGIISQAKSEAAEIIRQAGEQTDAEASALIEKTREQAVLIGRLSDSGSELERKKQLLGIRRRMIDDVINEAVERLRRLPAGEYFAVCEKLACRYAEPKAGEIVLSKADLGRVPEGFVEALNKKLAGKGASLSLATDTVESGGGFVLRYGGVEENCAFAAIVEQDREALSDRLGDILFK